MSKKKIKRKIKELKLEHYDVSNRMWIGSSGLSQDMELFKIESQINILKELLKDE